MSTLLSLAALTVLAQTTIQANPGVDKVFATADGNVFLPSALNLAREHGRQTKLEVHEIGRSGADSTEVLDHIATDAEANELKQQEEAAAAAALAAQASTPPATTPAVPVEAGALAQAVGKAAAVNKSAKATDAPAAEGKPADAKSDAANA